jgi:prephenate dehydrogenase
VSQPPSDDSKAPPSAAAAAAGPRPFGRFAVLGLGQLGGSLALAGRAAGLFDEVVGFGRRPEALARARQLGLCDRTETTAAAAVSGARTILLSVPLRSIAEVVDAMVPALAPGALIIDVGSVKGSAVRDIEARLPAGVAFVSCHPLAGTERFGPDAASADLFRGRRCILCPTERTPSDALASARGLWAAVGAEIVLMPAELHDHVMAAVSHLPHVAAFALASALAELSPALTEAARGLPTTSLRDTSRVAASSPTMWRDIFLENRPALLPLIDGMAARLGELAAAMRAGDASRLETFLTEARASRASLLPE